MKKHCKKLILTSAYLIIGVFIFWGNRKLKDQKRWIYSTGTNEIIFGDITWEMSQQEVERALGYSLFTDVEFFKSNQKKSLLNYENSYENTEVLFDKSILFNQHDYNTISPAPENLNLNYTEYFGKAIQDFMGVETGGIRYSFYKDKLCKVTIYPFATQFKEFNSAFVDQYNLFEKLLLQELHTKFGRLIIRKKTTIKEFNIEMKITNMIDSNVILDAYIFTNNRERAFNETLDIYLDDTNYLSGYINLRYRPIINQIKSEINTHPKFFSK